MSHEDGWNISAGSEGHAVHNVAMELLLFFHTVTASVKLSWAVEVEVEMMVGKILAANDALR